MSAATPARRTRKKKVVARKPLRVLYLTHPEFVPPETLEGKTPQEIAQWRSDFDIVSTLRALGHDVQVCGVADDLGPIRVAVAEYQPHIAWNSLEFFHDEPLWDHGIPSWLELMKVPYTGCNPRAMVLSRGKSLSKRLVAPYRILYPEHVVIPRGRPAKRPRGLEFPLIVKSLTEHASAGIAQASVVRTDEELAERVAFVHERIHTDAIAEEYIEGRELYVAVLGNRRLQVLPTWELTFDKMPEGAARIATAMAKRNVAYQERRGITLRRAADVDERFGPALVRMAKRIYRAFEFDAYARIDFRLTGDGRLYFLEANANADLGSEEELASAAAEAGIAYPELIQRVLNLGLDRHGRAWSGA